MLAEKKEFWHYCLCSLIIALHEGVAQGWQPESVFGFVSRIRWCF